MNIQTNSSEGTAQMLCLDVFPHSDISSSSESISSFFMVVIKYMPCLPLMCLKDKKYGFYL